MLHCKRVIKNAEKPDKVINYKEADIDSNLRKHESTLNDEKVEEYAHDVERTNHAEFIEEFIIDQCMWKKNINIAPKDGYRIMQGD